MKIVVKLAGEKVGGVGDIKSHLTPSDDPRPTQGEASVPAPPPHRHSYHAQHTSRHRGLWGNLIIII